MGGYWSSSTSWGSFWTSSLYSRSVSMLLRRPGQSQRYITGVEFTIRPTRMVHVPRAGGGDAGGGGGGYASNNEGCPKYKCLCIGTSHSGKTSLLRRYISNTFNEHTSATIGLDYYVKGQSATTRGDSTGTTETNHVETSSTVCETSELRRQSSSLSSTTNDNAQRDHNDPAYQICFFDVSGQDRFWSLLASFVNQSHAVAVVFSVCDRKSFEDIDRWCALVRRYAPQMPMLLVGTKVDIRDDDDYNQHGEMVTELTVSCDNNNNSTVTAPTTRALSCVSVQEATAKAAALGMLQYVETSAKSGQGVDVCFQTIVQTMCRTTILSA